MPAGGKGLLKCNCLVFGVASSPIFQRTMDNLLQNLSHVAVYLDDILVTGRTEEEHLLKRMSWDRSEVSMFFKLQVSHTHMNF